jgi:Protein of unknown function (DUF2786)
MKLSKIEAAEKVAKLRRLARGTSNEHEAATAEAQAKKIIAEYKLTKDDLSGGEKSDAFDDLVDTLHKFAVNHPDLPGGLFGTSAVIHDMLTKIKSIDKSKKNTYLGWLTGGIRTLSFISGDRPEIKELKRILDETLLRHGLVL